MYLDDVPDEVAQKYIKYNNYIKWGDHTFVVWSKPPPTEKFTFSVFYVN